MELWKSLASVWAAMLVILGVRGCGCSLGGACGSQLFAAQRTER
jgi:hypothetical protein